MMQGCDLSHAVVLATIMHESTSFVVCPFSHRAAVSSLIVSTQYEIALQHTFYC